MPIVEEHVRTVHQIVLEGLGSLGAGLFPGFRNTLESAFRDRLSPAEGLPWLMLPIFTCEALGGDPAQAQNVAAALEIGRIAAGCLDEWQDHDTDGALWQAIGAERTVSLAMGMVARSFLTLSRLSDLGAEPRLILELQGEFQRTLLQMCAGQYADLGEELSLDDYERVAKAKAGSLFQLGCRAGAMVAGASSEVISLYGEFGNDLGILGQAWNDLRGLAGRAGKRDVDQRRGLPILASQALDDTAYEPQSAEGQAGQLYALVQLQLLHRRAAEAMTRCPAPGRLPLFLDAYSPQPLLEELGQTAFSPEGYHGE